MLQNEFSERVRERTDLSSTAAARDFSSATMRTLGERLAAGEAEQLAGGLPDDIAGPLTTAGSDAEAFPPSEFVERVTTRADVGTDDTYDHVDAVRQTLSEHVTAGQWNDVETQLPPAYDPLVDFNEEAVGERTDTVEERTVAVEERIRASGERDEVNR